MGKGREFSKRHYFFCLVKGRARVEDVLKRNFDGWNERGLSMTRPGSKFVGEDGDWALGLETGDEGSPQQDTDQDIAVIEESLGDLGVDGAPSDWSEGNLAKGWVVVDGKETRKSTLLSRSS